MYGRQASQQRLIELLPHPKDLHRYAVRNPNSLDRHLPVLTASYQSFSVDNIDHVRRRTAPT
jgi:hypothetical protein